MPNNMLLETSRSELKTQCRALINRLMSRRAPSWEADGQIPRSVWKQLAQNGVFRLPKTGPDVWRTSIFLKELGFFGYGGIRSAIGVAAFMAPFYIEKFGSSELRTKYLPAIKNGNCIAALAISEAGSGSDLREIGCVGELEGTDFLVINGQKDFIANGRQADIFVTLVKTDKSSQLRDLTVSSFIVIDATSDCVDIEHIETMGWKSADICKVRFNHCHVGIENIVGRPNMAMIQLVAALDFERLVAGTMALGGARRSIENLIDTATTTTTKGKQLGVNQAVSHTIANHTSMLRMIEVFSDSAWELQADGKLDTSTATTLKLRATELEMAVAQDLLRFNGSNGFRSDGAPARFHRDAIAGTIAAGPSELMRDILYTEECASRRNRSKTHPVPAAPTVLMAVAGE